MNFMASKGVLLKDLDSNNIYPCPYFPVGSIYISVNSTNPSTYFGGTWEQIKGRFLVGTGANEANTTNYWGEMAAGQHNPLVGEMGGECRHTLTVSEMPSHAHAMRVVKDLATDSGGNLPKGNNSAGNNAGWTDYWTGAGDYAIQNTGGGGAHNNMPPYLAVYMWKRTA